MRLTEIATALFRIPAVDIAFIHQYEALEKHEARPGQGGGDWEYGHRRLSTYRVYLITDHGFADLERPSLRLAITEALAAAGLQLAQERAKAEANRVATLNRQPSALDEKERLAQGAEFRRSAAALVVTVAQLDALAAWLDPSAAPITTPQEESPAS